MYILSLLANNRYSFFDITGETNKSLVDIVREIQELFHHTVARHHTFFLRNRVMLSGLSLIAYPSYHMLSALFDISVPSVKEELHLHSCIQRKVQTTCKMAVIARMDELFRGIGRNMHLLQGLYMGHQRKIRDQEQNHNSTIILETDIITVSTLRS